MAVASRFAWCAIAVLASPAALARPAAVLPVYIEDSHAGTFYWMVRNLDLTSPHELVLIDAHSDATEVPDSDTVRRSVLEAAGLNRLDALTGEWRKRGVIQCFNWIEPLLPLPVTRVWWVAGNSLTDTQLAAKNLEVRKQINAHEMVRPRSAGDLRDRYQVTDWARFQRIEPKHPVVVSIDLDYFSGGPPGRLREVLDAVLALPDVEALTFAISRPYLQSDAEAHALLAETLRYLVRVVNVDIEFAPFADAGEDRSQKAKGYYYAGRDVPHYEIERAPPFLRTLIVQNADRIRGCERLADRWRGEAPRIQLTETGVRYDGGGTVRWKALVPAARTFNVTSEHQGFADRAGKFVRFVERDIADPAELTGLGTVRAFAEVDGALSNMVEFTRTEGDGYPAHLTELFQLPYIYGSALLNPDRRIGADCSSFLIYAARREGRDIPYVNPEGLLPYLKDVAEPVVATEELVRRGLLLHFGKHVAAVYRAGGVLRPSTPVVHQLEGYAEITTLGVLAARYPRVRVMTFR